MDKTLRAIEMGVEDLIDEIMNWIQIEADSATFFGGLSGAMTNDYLKVLFQKFYIDSLKHKRILEAIIRLLRAEKREITLELHPDIITSLKGYLDVEKLAMEKAGSLMSAIDDDIVKLMLKHIFKDEVEHHKLLERIIEQNE